MTCIHELWNATCTLDPAYFGDFRAGFGALVVIPQGLRESAQDLGIIRSNCGTFRDKVLR